jgi:hypothetical protein
MFSCFRFSKFCSKKVPYKAFSRVARIKSSFASESFLEFLSVANKKFGSQILLWNQIVCLLALHYIVVQLPAIAITTAVSKTFIHADLREWLHSGPSSSKKCSPRHKTKDWRRWNSIASVSRWGPRERKFIFSPTSPMYFTFLQLPLLPVLLVWIKLNLIEFHNFSTASHKFGC